MHLVFSAFCPKTSAFVFADNVPSFEDMTTNVHSRSYVAIIEYTNNSVPLLKRKISGFITVFYSNVMVIINCLILKRNLNKATLL